MAVAKPSRKVQKLEEKLKQRIEKEKARINEDLLKKMNLLNQQWLNRHKAERVPLSEERTVSRVPHEAPSQYVRDILKKLKAEAIESPPLKGRITTQDIPKEDNES